MMQRLRNLRSARPLSPRREPQALKTAITIVFTHSSRRGRPSKSRRPRDHWNGSLGKWLGNPVTLYCV